MNITLCYITSYYVYEAELADASKDLRQRHAALFWSYCNNNIDSSKHNNNQLIHI